MKIVDSRTHYGLKLYPESYVKDVSLRLEEIQIEKIVLNPAYKYACECCVDGFYQQYLWSVGKDYVVMLGMYNPKCRVRAEIEINRQVDKGIRGLVLHPLHHNYSLLDEKALKVIKIADDYDLPLFIFTPKREEILKIADNVTIPIVLIGVDYVIAKDNVYYEVNFNTKINADKEHLVYGSGSPYNKMSAIDSALHTLKVIEYDENVFYRNIKKILKI